ncbi:MAG: NAD(P)-dependent oxidoreductase [Limnochordia bacterium]
MIIDKPNKERELRLSFDEIDIGYSMAEAIKEAKRCLNCRQPLCREGCPINQAIPQFIQALAQGNLGQASEIIAEHSNLPAICGRVCPHEKQCEGHCILSRKGEPIRVGKLERFVADFEAEMELTKLPACRQLDQGRVAVIGSGPAGLTIAGDLAKLCYAVTVYEAQEEPGGLLMYGIPDFRLNKDVVRREIERIAKLGVQFETKTIIGPDLTVDDLFAAGYDAIFIGTGTSLPRKLSIPGEELPGVMQGAYFLRTMALVNAGKISPKENPISPGDHVVVIGGGNVALDAARTALRVGAERVMVVYRRDEEALPALKTDYEQAKAEGIEFAWWVAPTRSLGKDQLTGVELESVEADEKGELQKTGQRQTLSAHKAIVAIGQRPAARIVSTTDGIEVDEQGYVITRERPYGMTTRKGVFAGGDVVHEPATVVLAMREAQKVAKGIVTYVEAKRLMEEIG